MKEEIQMLTTYETQTVQEAVQIMVPETRVIAPQTQTVYQTQTQTQTQPQTQTPLTQTVYQEAETSGYRGDASAVQQSPDYNSGPSYKYNAAPTYNAAPYYSYNPNAQYQSYQGGRYHGGGQGGGYLSPDGRMYTSSQLLGKRLYMRAITDLKPKP
jgi:hypothetical protein